MKLNVVYIWVMYYFKKYDLGKYVYVYIEGYSNSSFGYII